MLVLTEPLRVLDSFSPVINLSMLPSSSARAKYLPQLNLKRRGREKIMEEKRKEKKENIEEKDERRDRNMEERDEERSY